MKAYGYGIVGSEGSLPPDAFAHPFEDIAKVEADAANNSTNEFYINRRPWEVVPLFYGVPKK